MKLLFASLGLSLLAVTLIMQSAVFAQSSGTDTAGGGTVKVRHLGKRTKPPLMGAPMQAKFDQQLAQPIVTDEPVPPGGFPPLPDRMDVPKTAADQDLAQPQQYGRSPAAPVHAGKSGRPGYHGDKVQSGVPGYHGESVQAGVPGYHGDTVQGGVPGYHGASANEVQQLGPAPVVQADRSEATDPPAPALVTQGQSQDLQLPPNKNAQKPKQQTNASAYVEYGKKSVINSGRRSIWHGLSKIHY